MHQPAQNGSAKSTRVSRLQNLSRRRLGEGGKIAILAGLAALVAGLVLSLGFYSITAPNESIASTLVILVFLPSVVICENLGLGHFSIFGSSTIPDWEILTVGILWTYLVSLVAVIAVRILWSCFRQTTHGLRRMSRLDGSPLPETGE
jgi:ABC-type Fe3+ transport system permease subunit